jgi:aminomethyltransferase
MSESVNPAPLQIPLQNLHDDAGARFGTFAGYDMPMRYEDGAVAEHDWCRNAASLFDVSHMGVIEIRGDERAVALESLVPAALTELAVDRGRYTFFTNEAGGVLDDLIVTNRGDYLQLVVNAGTKHDDLAHLRSNIGDGVEISDLLDTAILALQGPQAVDVLLPHASDLKGLTFGYGAEIRIGGATAWASRSGYTGEDGFELIINATDAEELGSILLTDERVELAGLAARDSLRLEAGLCLYGHELTPEISPIEAGLLWAIQKRRRSEGGFPGAETIQQQITEGPPRSRVGLTSEKRPVREKSLLVDGTGTEIGFVSSGGFGPTFDGPIAMGYVPPEYQQPGQTITAVQRGKEIPMTVTELPFAPHNYYRG